jgi:hypothetical protein
MQKLRKLVKAVVMEANFVGSRVTVRHYNNKPAIKVHIPIGQNGSWDDAYRERLNKLCLKFSELNLRWGAEYKGMNHLIENNKNGAPWMLFNGGEGIELINHSSV